MLQVIDKYNQAAHNMLLQVGKIAFLLACIFAFAACSGEYEPELSTSISFSCDFDAESASAGAPSRRVAAENAEGNNELSNFKVFAVKNLASETQTVMNGYDVTWSEGSAYSSTSNTSGWDYVSGNQTIKYWDFSATDYRFFGYVGEVSKSESDWSFSMNVDATAATTPYVSKLAYVTSGDYAKQVQMQFYHPLSKVRFILLDETGAPLESNDVATELVSVKSFAPLGENAKIYTSASATVSYPVSGTDHQESWTFDYASASSMDKMTIPYVTNDNASAAAGRITVAENGQQVDKTEYWYTVVPNPEQGEFQLSLTVAGAEKTAVIPAAYMQWQPNMSYTYKFKVSAEASSGIEFVGVAVRNWEDAETIESPVYNW